MAIAGAEPVTDGQCDRGSCRYLNFLNRHDHRSIKCLGIAQNDASEKNGFARKAYAVYDARRRRNDRKSLLELLVILFVEIHLVQQNLFAERAVLLVFRKIVPEVLDHPEFKTV